MPALPERDAGSGPPGHVRDPCNAGLQQRIEAWRRHGVSLRCTDQANGLKAVRDAVPKLAGYGFSAGQQVLRRLDKAFAAYIRRVKAGEAPGFPRFRSADSASETVSSAGRGGCGSSGSRASPRSGGTASCRRGPCTRSSAARTGSGA